ncbi:hypothetical protein KFK09_018715 [Dendrobium nobile]|uniref:Uncharacterized protein n=1 Tax=Dendrobium nobile TaxID=94219 RepID=A0A8T3AWL8_DENNO|nr:hypothetical protein KFK09_018711 [Dendrobium nobile]KAI0500501.1 hypothetical protein KFK09_018715 [Dendrobium nobile]
MPATLMGCGIPTTPPRHFSSFHQCCAAARSAEVTELRVCVNRSCGKQGSRETLEVLSSIAPHGVSIASCGCLGRCGAGPNLVVLPGGGIVSHCGTPARASRLLADICGDEFDPWRNLEVLSLRKKGEVELEKGNASEALALLNQAIELNPSGGLQFIYKARSAAKLGMGDNDGALEDAEEVCKIAPYFPQAYICQGDALLAMGDLNAAEKAYATALDIDPSIRRSKSFKARVAKLKEKLLVAST